MPQVTALKALNGYFNTGTEVSVESEGGPNAKATVGGVPAKRSLPTFRDEMAALTPEEKQELAALVVAVTGDALVAAK
jgi:hypothetical protein